MPALHPQALTLDLHRCESALATHLWSAAQLQRDYYVHPQHRAQRLQSLRYPPVHDRRAPRPQPPSLQPSDQACCCHWTLPANSHHALVTSSHSRPARLSIHQHECSARCPKTHLPATPVEDAPAVRARPLSAAGSSRQLRTAAPSVPHAALRRHGKPRAATLRPPVASSAARCIHDQTVTICLYATGSMQHTDYESAQTQFRIAHHNECP